MWGTYCQQSSGLCDPKEWNFVTRGSTPFSMFFHTRLNLQQSGKRLHDNLMKVLIDNVSWKNVTVSLTNLFSAQMCPERSLVIVSILILAIPLFHV